MKKTSKKLFALILAAMFILASVPFSASAAVQNPTNDVKIYGQRGVTYQLYKVAGYSEQTGAYDPVCQDTNDDVNKIIKSSEKTSADLLAALDALTSMSGYGEAVQGEVKITDTTAPKTYEDLEDGIYYFKATKLPVDAESITKNSVFVIPAEKADGKDYCEFDVTSKVKMLGEVDIHKTIQVSDGQGSTREVSSTTSGHDEFVIFKLKADITGSNENPLTKYIIADRMSTNLDATNYHIDSVNLVKADGTCVQLKSNEEYNVLTDTRTDAELAGTSKYSFIVSLDNDVLNPEKWSTNGSTFYDFARVEVIYTSRLIAGAKSGVPEKNRDDLFYSNVNVSTDKIETTDSKEDGDDVTVVGYKLSLLKVDSDNKPLKGAEFQLYNDRAGNDPVMAGKDSNIPVKAVSGDDGVAVFYLCNTDGSLSTDEFLSAASRSYFAKETKAPEGYNPITQLAQIDVNGVGTVNSPTVVNTKTMLPETGGAGTMMFTLIGAGLMIVAGVLFVVVYKKRSAK